MRAELDPILGDFVNVVPLRVKYDDPTTTSFEQVVRLVKTALLGGLMNQEYSFGLLVSKFQQHRDVTRTPIFQIMVVHDKPNHKQAELAPFILGDEGGELKITEDLTFKSINLVERMSEFDLVFVLSEGANGAMNCRVQYATDIYDESTIARIGEQWMNLMRSALKAPETTVSDLSVVSQDEINAMNAQNEATLDRFPALVEKKVMGQLFHDSVKAHPDAIAINCPFGRSLTYAQLDGLTNRLARTLRDNLQVTKACRGLDDLDAPTIAVFIPRSLEYIVAVVAAVKAGIPYTPLDPMMLVERAEFIAKDCGAKAMLTVKSKLKSVKSLVSGSDIHTFLCIDEITPPMDSPPANGTSATPTDADPVGDADGAAHISGDSSSLEPLEGLNIFTPMYCIYTSGSTGNPKGVMVHHAAAINVCCWLAKAHGVKPGDTSAQCLGAAFDPVVIEIWPFLISGASIVTMPDDTVRGDYTGVVDFLYKYGVSHLTFPTSLSMMIFEKADFPTDNCKLRVWSCGGDKFKGTMRPLPFTVANAYGPTEAAVQCSQYYINFEPQPASLKIAQPPGPDRMCLDPPIGTATANTAFYVLDNYKKPVPPGALGELWVGGAQVSMGYRNRPDATAGNFHPDPFGMHSEFALKHPDSEGKLVPYMYRTGDLVRLGEGRNVFFYGRRDFQVKIRGYRIELGEIEDQLSKCEEVRTNCVIVHSTDVDKYLFAFVILSEAFAKADKKEVKGSILRRLKQRLPSYMVPRLVIADNLALTHNGKIDRRRLPIPSVVEDDDDTAVSRAQNFVAPRNDAEKKLCGIWEELLHTKPIGVTDNWYDRGGTSLTSTLLLSRMRQLFQMEIAISQFFADPTVQGLAKIVSEKGQVTVAENLTDVLSQDASRLPSSICAEKENVLPFLGNAPTSVLLTGVTGFLGAFIAAELLKSTECLVYCLVRASSEAEASKRVVENMGRYQLLEDLDQNAIARVVPVVGDLGKPLFGMTQSRWNDLCGAIEAIIHNGALVNFGYPYVSLRPANVEGTLTVLKLATTTRIKPVHFISTLSVIVPPHGKAAILEEPLGPSTEGLQGGYTQSKWVAERLVGLARSRGVPATIFRPGRITGHTQTGATNVDDFLNLLVKGCIQMKCAPDVNMPCEMTPVDFCAKAIVDICFKTTDWANLDSPHVFHLTNTSSLPFRDVFETICKVAGHPTFEMLPYPVWRKERLLQLNNDSHNALLPLVPMFGEDFEEHAAPVVYSIDQLNSALKSIKSPLCPETNVPLIEKYAQYFLSVGFLPLPEGKKDGQGRSASVNSAH